MNAEDGAMCVPFFFCPRSCRKRMNLCHAKRESVLKIFQKCRPAAKNRSLGMKKYNIAVVGATGMVGRKFLQVLEERNLPVENYYLFASARSAGKKVDFMGKEY